jgi:predicted DNA-binding transcriptional regulator YafY
MGRTRGTAINPSRLPHRFPKKTAKNKVAERLVRLLDLIHLISTGSGWTPAKLANRFQLSIRRLYHDFEVLSRIGIRFVQEKTGYRLLSHGGPFPVPLRIPEILALLSPGRADLEFLRTAQIKLSSALPTPLKDLFKDPRKMSTSIQVTPVDSSVWSVIDECIAAGHRIQFRYKGNNDDMQRSRVADPYAVFLKRGGWYLAAWAVERSGYRCFRIDRMEAVSSTKQAFVARDDFELAKYTENPLGVGVGQLLHAKIEVLPGKVAAIQSEAKGMGLHFTANGRGGVLQITSGVPDQIAWWLAQYGEGVRVLTPASLRARLREIGRRIVALNKK